MRVLLLDGEIAQYLFARNGHNFNDIQGWNSKVIASSKYNLQTSQLRNNHVKVSSLPLIFLP